MQRRELFGSVASVFRGEDSKTEEETRTIRPPYNNDGSLFYRECGQCDAKCAAVCEEEIIKIGEDKTPYLSFGMSGCTFCDACAGACEFGVLALQHKKDIDLLVNISLLSCIAWDGTMCFSCKDPCLENAIVFQGLFKPVIDQSTCTGCGFCISRCPTSAIEIEAVS